MSDLWSVGLRPVTLADAALIFELRNQAESRAFLAKGAGSPAAQGKWLEDYFARRQRHEEHYFIVTHRGFDVGTVRVYDVEPVRGSFSWGSWTIRPGVAAHVAFSSVILVYDFCFVDKQWARAEFEVRNENRNVVRFHKDFGATCLAVGESTTTFEVLRDRYPELRSRLLKKTELLAHAG